jgi:hypothetical protein
MKPNLNPDHVKEYIAFLEKRLASKNYKDNVSAEDFKLTQEKLKKAKFLLKTLSR